MKSARNEYDKPRVVRYGSLLDRTFTNPGGHVKSCSVRCNVDNFGETAGRPDFADHPKHPTS